jgi:hypothetical protein
MSEVDLLAALSKSQRQCMTPHGACHLSMKPAVVLRPRRATSHMTNTSRFRGDAAKPYRAVGDCSFEKLILPQRTQLLPILLGFCCVN